MFYFVALWAGGVRLSGNITGQIVAQYQKQKPYNTIHTSITQARCYMDAAKNFFIFECGYEGVMNGRFFEKGCFFEENYLWFRCVKWGELRLGNTYAHDIEWATPAQKLIDLDSTTDGFYNNHSGFYHGLSSIASPSFAPKVMFTSKTFGTEDHYIQGGLSYTSDITFKGFQLQDKMTGQDLGYWSCSYANIWFSEKAQVSGDHHITAALQYYYKRRDFIATLTLCYLFGKSSVQNGDNVYPLNDTHAFVLAGKVIRDKWVFALEFIHNGKGKLPQEELKDLTLINAHKGDAGKSIIFSGQYQLNPLWTIALGVQHSWNALTDRFDSRRTILTGIATLNISSSIALYIKGAYIDSSLAKEAEDEIRVLAKDKTKGSNSGGFIATGVKISF